jgi:hypothetical protein
MPLIASQDPRIAETRLDPRLDASPDPDATPDPDDDTQKGR